MGSLEGRVALVTGVSRRQGIGYAIAQRLAGLGADLFVQHHVAHDAGQPWGADVVDEVLADIGARGLGVDLARPEAPDELMAAAVKACGRVDVLVCNHARSGGDGPLGALDAAMLDEHYAVNTRSSILLAQAFARQWNRADGGRIVFMTSGQNLGPMPGEIAYAASKGALAAIVATLSHELADRGITVNAVNPGPTDTGWAGPELTDVVNERMPLKRWGQPDDAARLISWLCTDDAAWITGQVIDSEGGFRR
ncbi:3-oxoacyl-[acyl-carrier protein] reductase [Lentzea albidocapillata subsp. violacea]|uniref:3-oxoacyl-[acyl-carrier protein] reductase n=1 Tax=Lentzea albidocapillata subsp. violacea TaxID=128104 RepID=A0A1G9G188_9PSEU|nr:SDR family oxidoreductase [Lentzea albidocapillata]SDK94406.1 3-oxoacyl-[acyl-carrier protein] reductase [Lentzea albidocapillata subsp. violacea]